LPLARLATDPSRARASQALRDFVNAGDRLRAAQRRAGLKHAPPKVGANLESQRILAKRSPEHAEAAIEWIEAEIDYLEHYEASIQSDRAANVINVPRHLVPAADADLLVELRRRVMALGSLAAEIEDMRSAGLACSLGKLHQAWHSA